MDDSCLAVASRAEAMAETLAGADGAAWVRAVERVVLLRGLHAWNALLASDGMLPSFVLGRGRWRMLGRAVMSDARGVSLLAPVFSPMLADARRPVAVSLPGIGARWMRHSWHLFDAFDMDVTVGAGLDDIFTDPPVPARTPLADALADVCRLCGATWTHGAGVGVQVLSSAGTVSFTVGKDADAGVCHVLAHLLAPVFSTPVLLADGMLRMLVGLPVSAWLFGALSPAPARDGTLAAGVLDMLEGARRMLVPVAAAPPLRGRLVSSGMGSWTRLPRMWRDPVCVWPAGGYGAMPDGGLDESGLCGECAGDLKVSSNREVLR